MQTANKLYKNRMNNTSSEVLRFRLSSLVPNNNDRQFLWLKLTFGLYIVTFILGCIGNVSVLIVTGFKTIRRRRPHELFILNLAIGDFILIVFFYTFSNLHHHRKILSLGGLLQAHCAFNHGSFWSERVHTLCHGGSSMLRHHQPVQTSYFDSFSLLLAS